MDSGLNGKTVLVTGASGGIGGAITRAFADEGAAVAIHYHQDEASARALADELDVPTMTVQADLADEGQVDRLYAAVLDRFDRLDGVVANAGRWSPTTPLHEMSLDQWRTHIDINLQGTFLTCRGFLRHLAADPRDEAFIVMIGSTAAVFGEANHADYSAAKAGLTYGLTRSLKNEIVRLAPLGRVNTVCPGWTETPMAAATTRDPEGVARATRTMALRKTASPEDMARSVVFLASPRLAGHITGSILTVAGGMEGRQLHD